MSTHRKMPSRTASAVCRRRLFWIGCFFLLGAALLPSALAAESVEKEFQLLPDPVAAEARELILTGVQADDVLQLIHAMQADRFEPEQIREALSIVVKARREGLPSRPIINKTLEGVAKRVAPERTLRAMETVRSRYATAYRLAQSLEVDEKQVERLGDVLAEGFAAGLSEPDAAQILNQLREKSMRLPPGELNHLATTSLSMARDMSRLGIPSTAASEVVAGALSRGFNTAEIASMHSSMLIQSQTQSPQSLARSYADAVHQGQLPHGSAGAGQGAPGHGASPGSGAGGGPGAGGSGGGSGGGSPGGGSGGGSGGGGPGGGGSGGGSGGGGPGGGSGGGSGGGGPGGDS